MEMKREGVIYLTSQLIIVIDSAVVKTINCLAYMEGSQLNQSRIIREKQLTVSKQIKGLLTHRQSELKKTSR